MFSLSKIIKILGILVTIKALITDKNHSQITTKQKQKKDNKFLFICGAGIGFGIIATILFLALNGCCLNKKN